ncbi:MAG: Mce protein, partial [Mycobacterium sp.]
MSDAEAPQTGARDEEHSDPPARRRAHIRWLIAAVLAAVLTGVGGYAGWLQFERHQTEVAAQQALAAAVKYTVALTNFDSQAMDRNIATLR